MSIRQKLLALCVMIPMILTSCSAANNNQEHEAVIAEKKDSESAKGTASNTISEKQKTIIASFEEDDDIGFDDLVLLSNVAVVGKYEEVIINETYVEYKFKVKEVLYGEVEDEDIFVYSDIGDVYVSGTDYSYKIGGKKYTEGNDYILVLEKHESIMYDHDRYLVDSDVILDETQKKYEMYNKRIDIPDGESVKDYIVSVYNSIPHEVKEKDNKVYSDSEEEMLTESDYIGIVSILSLEVEKKNDNSNVYRCRVDSLSKGEKLNKYEDGTILLSLMKGKVEVGDKYEIGFNSVDEYSLIYIQATKDSVKSLEK